MPAKENTAPQLGMAKYLTFARNSTPIDLVLAFLTLVIECTISGSSPLIVLFVCYVLLAAGL